MDKLLLSHHHYATPITPPAVPLLTDRFRWVNVLPVLGSDCGGWLPSRPLGYDGEDTKPTPGCAVFRTMRGSTLEEAVWGSVIPTADPIAFATAWLDPEKRPRMRACHIFPARDVDPIWLDPEEVTCGMVHDAITAVCCCIVAKQQQQQQLADTPATLL